MAFFRVFFLSAVSSLVLAALPAAAKPKLDVSIAVTKEVADAKGAKATKTVAVKEAAPGEVLRYTISYVNRGDEVARDAVVDNPIPQGATYIGNSATGEGADILFSSDGGKSFAPPTKLTYQLRLPDGRTEARVATPGEYTHVRWTLRQVPPGAGGKLAFQVKVN